MGSTRREHVERKREEQWKSEEGLKISRNNTEYLGTTNTKTQRSIYWERLNIPGIDFGGRWRTTECRADGITGRECLECYGTGK